MVGMVRVRVVGWWFISKKNKNRKRKLETKLYVTVGKKIGRERKPRKSVH